MSSLLEELLIRVAVDATGAIRSIDQVSRKSDEMADSAQAATNSIDAQIKALEFQEKTLGMTKNEITLYKLAQDGATKADIERARAAIDSIEAFDKQGRAVEKNTSALQGFAAKALGAFTAAFAVGNTIGDAITRAGDIKQLAQTADSLGVAVENLDAFGKAAEQAGGDAQGARDSLTDMAEKIGEAFSDAESGAAKAFKALGISVKDADGKAKDSLTGFLDLAEAVEGLDKSTAVFKIKELGITDNKSVDMILKGRKELERMIAVQKEQGVVTKEMAERAGKLTDTLAALKGSVSSASNGFLDSMIPALTKVFEWLKIVVDWAGEHKDLVVGFFVAIATIVTAAYLPAMIAAAAATLAATWPIIAIGAAIAVAAAAFALIYDDIMNFIDGNESFIGQIFEKYPMVQAIVMQIIDIFKFMFDTLVTGAKQIGEFVTAGFLQVVAGIKFAIDYLAEAYGSISGFVDASVKAFQSMGEGIAAVFRFIVDTVKSSLAFVTAGIDKIKGVVSKVAGVVGINVGSEQSPAENQAARPSGSGQDASDVPMLDDVAMARQGLPAANDALLAASATPMNGVTSSAISNTTTKNSETNVQTGDIIVQTQATDAQGISQDIGGSLKGELKGMTAEFATGADR